jgi:calcineurin-like phosphoesterase family protein
MVLEISGLFLTPTDFGHSNIIRYCKRPFKDVAEMDEILVENINKMVRPEDTLWHLGDFAFGRTLDKTSFAELRNSINCRNIHLILGNHDKKIAKSRTLKRHFSSVSYCFAGYIGGVPFILTHMPPKGEKDQFVLGMTQAWGSRERNFVHLFGHTHNNEDYDPQNMCVEYTDYQPVPLEEISRRRASFDNRP